MSAETRKASAGVVGNPVSAYLARLSVSGIHLARRSGLGRPLRFFSPLVMRFAAVSDKARPNQPVNSSHSLRCHINDFGVNFKTVGPGTRSNETSATMTAGASTDANMRVVFVTVSWTVKGKLMLESPREKGRLLGVWWAKI